MVRSSNIGALAAQPRNVERVSPRSLFSLRLRCRPSSTNSTAAAIAAGLPVAPSLPTAPFIPGIWSACFTYSWLDMFGERSEEHTSELQSRPHLVCRLLLE